MRNLLALAALPVALLVAFVGASRGAARTLLSENSVASGAAPPQRTYTGYPNSIAVLGHSGATGYNSDPRRPRADAKANSWATGTNPAVKSVYLRLLAKNPKIRGHNVNLAQDGAKVAELVKQAKRAVALKRSPELILIQIMDNDIVCPAARSDYAAFRETFVSALETLSQGLPDARLFVVSQFGSPTTYARAVGSPPIGGGSGPCDFFNPSHRLVPRKLARLERTIHGYEAQLAAGCKQIQQCRYDGGAFGRIVDKREHISGDLNHFSVRGHAKAAAVAWSAIKRAGLVPR